ncbi:MAG: hypothetical protein E6Q35_02865 [Chryseobacterium cucumeris]|nr:MAG: hypothetical protein E6Q35_02865 [Chryseobacterium cucumeris]
MGLTRAKEFILFMKSIIKMGLSLWKTRATFEVKEIKDIICLHFHPELVPEPAIIALKKDFLDVYVKLSGKDPIVIALPIGYNISSLQTDEFVSILNTKQINEMQRALYYKRGKIEVVAE